MSSQHEDFTICWVPPAIGPLGRFGTLWTGWCHETRALQPRFSSPWAGLDLRAIARGVSLRGLHGVFHGPFRLKEGCRIFAIERALRTLADETPTLTIRGLEIGVVGNRVALVPTERSRALDDLTRRVRALAARFEEKAPAGESAETESQPTARPGVAVRPVDSFHLPLTDRLQKLSACHVASRLRPLVRHLLDSSHTVAELSLLEKPGGRLRARTREPYPVFDGTGGSDSTFACCGPRLYTPLPGQDAVAGAV